MFVDIDAIMGEPITVCNRVAAVSQGGEDSWLTTTVQGFWHSEDSESASTYRLEPAATVKVQFAESDAGGYVEPAGWAGSGWTLRTGDMLVRGEVDCNGTLPELLEAIGSTERCSITKVEDLRLGGAAVGLTGPGRWASVLYIEGR